VVRAAGDWHPYRVRDDARVSHWFPALMIGALVSVTISRRMNRQSFYDTLLQQDGHQIEHVKTAA